jgi:hypothetical protein
MKYFTYLLSIRAARLSHLIVFALTTVIGFIFSLTYKYDPTSAAVRSDARNVFAHSNAGIVGYSPTWSMDVCLCLRCTVQVTVLQRVATPFKESYRLSVWFIFFINSEWERARGPNLSKKEEKKTCLTGPSDTIYYLVQSTTGIQFQESNWVEWFNERWIGKYMESSGRAMFEVTILEFAEGDACVNISIDANINHCLLS